MTFLSAIFMFAFAGAMNGSFALPSKRLQQWPYQRIWLNYSVWAFLIFPCLFITALAPMAWKVYFQTPPYLMTIIVVGGFLFAIGQICFSRALKMIGLGLGFVINISIGTTFGSLLPLVMFHREHLLTKQGAITMLGIGLIIFGVVLSYIAGVKRDKNSHYATQNNQTYLGMLLATLAGIFSAGQNITFSYTQSLQTQALQMGINHLVSANIIWPAFLIATFIPYTIYMLRLRHQYQSTETRYRSLSYYFATLIMGAFWFFSLIIYSAASLKMGELGPVIGWPLFMVCIILTANVWSWRQGEWVNASVSAKRFGHASVISLIIAILVLAGAS